MTATISIRPYVEEDEGEVLALLRRSLGESEVLRRTPELFAWKHLDNPFGRSIMLVAEDSVGIVGFRAFLRWELVAPKKALVRCVRPVDTATDPRAQRQGVFRRLTEAAVDVAREDGVDLIFNTPNSKSRPGYLSMGWTDVGSIGVMVRPLAGFWRKAGRPPSMGATAEWDELAVTHRPPLGLRTNRTAAYLTWRYTRHPTAHYGVVGSPNHGMAVLRSNLRAGRGEIVVSDLFGTDPAAAIRTAAHNTDAAYLIGWFSKGAPERGAAVRAGMLPVPGVRSLSLVARPLPRSDRVPAMEEWDLSIGDLELL